MINMSSVFLKTTFFLVALYLTGCDCNDTSQIDKNIPCTQDDECQNDSFCQQAHCVPYGPQSKEFDPACEAPASGSAPIDPPILKCKWEKTAVRMAPVVADIDGDQLPEIIFVDADYRLVALRGDNCTELFATSGEVGSEKLSRDAQLAVADVNGDKRPEIIGVSTSDKLVIFDHSGVPMAVSAEHAKIFYSSNSYGGPAVANLDGVGAPEIVYGGMALRLEGSSLTMLYNVAVNGGSRGALTAIADVDLDGKPDLVVGNNIFDGPTGQDKTPAAVKSFAPGHVAIGQFDRSTPEPEIVLISSQNGTAGVIRIFHPVSGAVVFGPYDIDKENGGPPTIADFDGDGQPEVGVAGYDHYFVFDPDCAMAPLPKDCSREGVLWEKSTRDVSSSSTGSSVFDFNADGRPEVVYRDECWLRIYDGLTGAVEAAVSMTSYTWMELPVLADVDADGHVEIVATADQTVTDCKSEADLKLSPETPKQGLFVFAGKKKEWGASRKIWNQHTYHITNILDDCTVPLKETPSWESHNNYRQNTQGLEPVGSPGLDATSRHPSAAQTSQDCQTAWTLSAEVCSRGAENLPQGVRGAFYQGDPRQDGKVLCTTATTKELAPGECETVKCDWKNPTTLTIDLWFRSDDDGVGSTVLSECKAKNNLYNWTDATCG